MSTPDHWTRLARHSPLGLLVDLDGTLVPFAERPDLARPTPDLVAMLDRIAASPGIVLAIVSGRPRSEIEQSFGHARSVWLAAEHGAFLRDEGVWRSVLDNDGSEIEDLHATLAAIALGNPGALVERKTASVAFHFRRVPRRSAAALRVEVEAAVEAWLAAHPGYERMPGAEVLEVRPAAARKSAAVAWVRERAGSEARLVALGDDITDEDMFEALGAADEAVLVAPSVERPTAARWLLDGPAQAIGFLRWLAGTRIGAAPGPPVLPRPIPFPEPGARASAYGLLAISNRLPEPVSSEGSRKRQVGGLVSALEPVLAAREGLWLGWSGETTPGPTFGPVRLGPEMRPALASIDLPQKTHQLYYGGFCNRALWPLFHTLPGRVRFVDTEWEAYATVNARFAAAAADLTPPDCAIWVHDFHLLLVASELRRLGHVGPMGLFLHVPFPGADLFRLIPWADQLLEGILDFDLVGVQTSYDVRNVMQVVGALSPATVSDDAVQHRGRRIRVRAFPIGTIPETFEPEDDPEESEETTALLDSVEGRRLLLGVDRLDYTKGIHERIEAFGRMLELFPEWRGQVSYVQISVPSRADVVDYREQRTRIEAAVGRINGELGEAHWTPVRYLYRSYGQAQLARFYREADVGLVTPLRDGMNLVAKEFVAAQEPDRPGVLVLSRFAGAALELVDAVLTNPYHKDGMARDIDRALRMPLAERVERHARLSAAVQRATAPQWAESYVGALEACRSG
ncbi:MAG TPA: trehalose-phosphatase [Planctomycetota bacterium]|nr:trehalose-phosphatase [Planctomycetota bacterium]